MARYRQFIRLSLVLILLPTGVWAQVSGFCFLQDEVEHAGTWVLFTADSPSAVTDSTQTLADGSFTINLTTGLYGVEYRHDGYIPHQLAGSIFVDPNPVELDTVTLTPGQVIEVSGYPGNSHWTTGTIVRVVATVGWAQFDTLIIDPGVTIQFTGYYGFHCSGHLEARGTVADSIVFESGLPDPGDNDYNSIVIGGCCSGGMEYCSIRNARSLQFNLSCTGDPGHTYEVRNSRVEYCYYGINILGSPARVIDCHSLHNRYGIRMSGCDTSCVIQRCLVQDIPLRAAIDCQNSASQIIDCVIEDVDPLLPHTVGIDARNGSPSIRGCTIRDATEVAIDLENGDSRQLIEDCLIVDNNRGIRAATAIVDIRNNTIVNNTNEGIVVTTWGWDIYQNIIAGNGMGLLLDGEMQEVSYNDIWGNGVNYAGTDLPFMFGELVTTNANGDSADIYLNLFVDPQFVDGMAGNFELQAGSPCIDAGSPDPAYYDPDGTVSDQGAYPCDQTAAGVPLIFSGVPLLQQNVPNPFNPVTRISYILFSAGRVSLRVFDVSGQLVTTLKSGIQEDPGPYRVTWNGTDRAGRSVASGVYFYRLTAGKYTETRRMVLVR